MQGVSLLQAVAVGETGHDAMVIEEHQRRGYMGFKNNFRARSLITQGHRLTLYEGVNWVNCTTSTTIERRSETCGMSHRRRVNVMS
jgi:hypothetical protein